MAWWLCHGWAGVGKDGSTTMEGWLDLEHGREKPHAQGLFENNSDLCDNLEGWTSHLAEAVIVTGPNNRLARDIIRKYYKEQGRHGKFLY